MDYVLLGWLLFIMGIAIVCSALGGIYAGVSSTFWPRATGRMLDAAIITRYVGRRSGEPKARYHLQVKYTFNIGSSSYRSSRLGAFILAERHKSTAENRLAALQSNASVMVFYHPGFPAVSALIPGLQEPLVHLFILSIGAIITLASGAALFSEHAM